MTSPSTALVRTARRKGLLRRVIDAVTPAALARTGRPFYPPSPFERWDYDRTADAIAEAFDDQTIDVSMKEDSQFSPSPGQVSFLARRSYANPVQVNRAFFQGDHWQNGDGWIGPHPAATDIAFSDSMQEIANIFTSKNVVREITIRHMLGCLGKAMQFGFVPQRELDKDEKPTPQEEKLATEAMALLRPWLKNRKVITTLRDAVCTLLLSERAALRLMVPVGMARRNDRGELIVSARSVEEALRFIFVEHPLPDNSAVITDPDTKTEAGLWQYTAADDANDDLDDDASLAEGGETTLDDPDGDEDYAAITFIDENGITVTKIFAEGTTVPDSESSLDLGGRLTMFEMRRAALITVQVQQQQRSLNLAESMIPRTSVTAGFLERLMIDAQLPGKPELDAAGNKTGRWIEEPFYVGAGTTNFIQSAEYMDEEGKIKRASAKMQYRDPITAEGPIAASEKHYRSMLDETGQLHVVMAGDSNPSGTSRINARLEYLSTLQLTSGEVEAAFMFILNTALAMAEALSQQVGYYTNTIRAQASCRLDTGSLTPEERTAIEASIGKTISRETAMALCNVEDIDAEKARMAADPLARAELGLAVGGALTALTTPGASLEGAAKFLGMEPDLLKDLLTSPPPAALPGQQIDPKTGKPVALPTLPALGDPPKPKPNAPADAKTTPASDPGSAP